MCNYEASVLMCLILSLKLLKRKIAAGWKSCESKDKLFRNIVHFLNFISEVLKGFMTSNKFPHSTKRAWNWLRWHIKPPKMDSQVFYVTSKMFDAIISTQRSIIFICCTRNRDTLETVFSHVTFSLEPAWEMYLGLPVVTHSLQPRVCFTVYLYTCLTALSCWHGGIKPTLTAV